MSELFKPLQLGPLLLPTNIVQAPLAGYSCAPFRRLIHQFGGCGYATTEMISAKHLVRQTEVPKRYLYKDPKEGLLCYQLSGDVEDDLSRAVEIVAHHGADLIDLNCGCPQRKIRKKGCGSKLLASPDRLYRLLAAIRKATDLPCSAKIRVDGDSEEAFNREVQEAIEAAGMDFMVVHGRHWTERYDVPSRLDEIRGFVQRARIPVLANGDAEDYNSVKKILNETKAAGMMIGRGSIGRPWLYAKIQAQHRGKLWVDLSFKELEGLLKQHIEGLVELEGDYVAQLQSRKLVDYYIRD